jgi:hypothetical protein
MPEVDAVERADGEDGTGCARSFTRRSCRGQTG